MLMDHIEDMIQLLNQELDAIDKNLTLLAERMGKTRVSKISKQGQD